MQLDHETLTRRVLRLLRQGPARCEASATKGTLLLSNGLGAVQVPEALLEDLFAGGLLARRDGHIALADAAPLPPSKHQPMPRELSIIDVDIDGARQAVLANLDESPLAQLVRVRRKDGTPFLAASEVEAGERLRADYTFGRIMPRLGANWEAPIASGRRAAGGHAADLTDRALAARQRVDRALSAVGPELSGVLVDVCCFLKGLETVERERGWPVRSAKIVLKTALGVLGRHYRPPVNERRHAVMHWGAEDFRPSLT